jgi:cardiolipin synthase
LTISWIIIIFVIFVLIISWLRIDFKCGLKIQKSKAKKGIQYLRYGQCELLTTGKALFTNIFESIDHSKDHIHVLFYIIQDDNIGQEFLNKLKDKAKKGVRVRLLVDYIGSGLKRKTVKELIEAGVYFAYANPPKFPYLFFTLNRRNHRKLVVIDGEIGFIGGYNVGDEYLGLDPKFGNWRDFHVKIIGDGVQDLQEQFLHDWKIATKEKLYKGAFYPPLLKGMIPLTIVPTDGAFLEGTFIDLIKQAETSITIGTPYFIPGERIQEELLAAAKREVAVRLIVPKKGDHPLVKAASFPYFTPLLKSGCEVFQYINGFYHTKLLVVDDKVCSIGTANFDKRSLYLDHEINCLIFDRAFIKLVLTEIEYDIIMSKQLTINQLNERSILQRGKEVFSTWMSVFL